MIAIYSIRKDKQGPRRIHTTGVCADSEREIYIVLAGERVGEQEGYSGDNDDTAGSQNQIKVIVTFVSKREVESKPRARRRVQI